MILQKAKISLYSLSSLWSSTLAIKGIGFPAILPVHRKAVCFYPYLWISLSIAHRLFLCLHVFLSAFFGRSLLSQGLGPEASERARERERHSRERHMAREARIPAKTCPRSLQPGRAAISAHSRGLGKCSKRETEGERMRERRASGRTRKIRLQWILSQLYQIKGFIANTLLYGLRFLT